MCSFVKHAIDLLLIQNQVWYSRALSNWDIIRYVSTPPPLDFFRDFSIISVWIKIHNY